MYERIKEISHLFACKIKFFIFCSSSIFFKTIGAHQGIESFLYHVFLFIHDALIFILLFTTLVLSCNEDSCIFLLSNQLYAVGEISFNSSRDNSDKSRLSDC